MRFLPLDLERIAEEVSPRAKLVRTWALSDGATALEVRRPDGESRKFVVRRHRRAAAEFRLLRLLHETGLQVPKPYVAGAEYVVTAFVEGESGTEAGDPVGLAATLAALHRADWTGVDLSFLPRLSNRNDSVLLHGDFWPGNTLWRDGVLVALIDWEDARVGDPLTDLGNGRLELLFAFGEDAMNEFTATYRAAMPQLDYADLPAWDAFAINRLVPAIPDWGLDPAREKELRRRSQWFAARAADTP